MAITKYLDLIERELRTVQPKKSLDDVAFSAS